MAKNTIHSIEEAVEDWCKHQFESPSDYYTKTQSISVFIESRREDGVSH
ncbi:MAG: hypothetical protein Q4E55_07800 [Bacteroidales bacterium]|nr:hypothetical protein [Bacteroidales bacterium]